MNAIFGWLLFLARCVVVLDNRLYTVSPLPSHQTQHFIVTKTVWIASSFGQKMIMKSGVFIDAVLDRHPFVKKQ